MIDCGCSMAPVMELRKQVVPHCFGEVLEVGMGSGINLELYNPSTVTKVWGLEPSLGMRKRAQKNLNQSPVTVEWLDLPGEQVPLADESVDCALLTFTLCTIPDWRAAMAQIHRVLRPGGKLFFCEHGLAPDACVQAWQNRLNNFWGKFTGGCNLNRPVLKNVEASAFTIDWFESEYMDKSPKFVSHMTWGRATKN